MAELFASGRMIDIILALVAVEALVIGALSSRLAPRARLGAQLPTLLSGVFLLLAVRAALTGAPWYLVAAPLTGALLAHGADLAWRVLERDLARH